MFVESTVSDSICLCVWHDERIIVSVHRLTQSERIRIFNETKRNDTTTFVLSHCPHKSTEFLLVCFEDSGVTIERATCAHKLDV